MQKLLLICLLILASCQQAPEPVIVKSEPIAARSSSGAPEFLSSDEFKQLGLPFSEAVRVGNQLYLSGQIGVLPASDKLVPGGVVAETRQAMENIKAIVEKNGSSMDRVFKCTVFMADNAERDLINEVYISYFPRNLPARSGVGANGLALGARVEIECAASLPGDWKEKSERTQKPASRRPVL